MWIKFLRSIAWILLLLALPGAVLARDLQCDVCRRPIDGQYRIYEGKNLHDSCYGANYTFYCDKCSLPITGAYSIFEGKNLHEQCYQRDFALHCTLCGRTISGPYTYTFWGDTLHSRHNKEYPRCDYCNRLIFEKLTGVGVRLPDSREVCGRCNALAVNDLSEARALMEQVLSTLSVRGVDIESDFRLKLVDKFGMSRISNERGHEAWGITEFQIRTSFFGLVESQSTQVSVLSGLPRVTLMGVLAHELMHVWLFANASPVMNDVLSEGSCEYASYLVMKNLSSIRADQYLAHQEASEDPVYGTGFRKVRDFVERVGISGWLDYLKNNILLP